VNVITTKTVLGIVYRRIRIFTSIGAIGLLIATTTTSSAGTIALDVTSDTMVFATGTFNNVGWQFTVNAPILVDGLGVFDVGSNGLTESHQVGLWDNLGNLLATTTVNSGGTLVLSASNTGDWLFNSIAPVLLLPGTYVTGAFYATRADQVMANATITTVPEVSFAASRASNDAGFAEPGVYGLVQPGVFGPNFSIVTGVSSVPDEGNTFALLMIGAAGLLVFRRSRKTQTA